MKRGRPRLDGLDAMLPGKEFVKDKIRNLPRAKFVPYRDASRESEMVEMYRAGRILQEIGDQYEISRERVRQILARLGANGYGGQLVRTMVDCREAQKRETILRAQRQEARCSELFGVSVSEFCRITGLPGFKGAWAALAKRTNPIVVGFLNQRRNANTRGIPFLLSLREWWDLWQESGHWHQRGRGGGYCMARWADEGPYSVENVYICTNSQNIRDSYITKPAAARRAKAEVRKAATV